MIVGALIGWTAYNLVSDVATAIQAGAGRSNLTGPYLVAAACAALGALVGALL